MLHQLPPTAAPAPEVAHHCPANDRGCFPHDLTDRGSGRLAWYQLRLGGYEPITYPDGTVNQEYVFDRITVSVPDGLGFGATMAALRATAAAHRPGMKLVGHWATEEPAEEF